MSEAPTTSRRDKRAIVALGLASVAFIVADRVQTGNAGPTARKIASFTGPTVLSIGGTVLALYGAFAFGPKAGIAALAVLGATGYVNRSRLEHGKAPIPFALPGLTVDLSGRYQALPHPLSAPLAFDFKAMKAAS